MAAWLSDSIVLPTVAPLEVEGAIFIYDAHFRLEYISVLSHWFKVRFPCSDDLGAHSLRYERVIATLAKFVLFLQCISNSLFCRDRT